MNDLYNSIELIETLGMLIQGLGILFYIILIVSLLVPYLITGYMLMCVGRKARLNDDWMPFVPIARQLYQMKIADCPWWYIFLFGNTFVTGALTVLIAFLFGALFGSAVFVLIFTIIYGAGILVFTFLYYRKYYVRFGFNSYTAWVEIIWSFGIVSTVLLVLVAFSDAIRFRGEGEEPEAVFISPGGNNVRKEQTPSVSPSGASAVVTGVAGAYAGASFDLKEGTEVVFGRSSSDSNVVFDQFETDISRKHCGVRYDARAGHFIVTDFSTNGTYGENGLMFAHGQPTPAARGTIIYLGKNKKNSFRLG